MPYKRSGSPFWQVAPVLPRFGRIGPYSTRVRDRKTAERIHLWLQELGKARPQLIEHLLAGRLTLPELWVARELDRLDELQRHAEDPPLKDAVSAMRSLIGDDRTRSGLDQLLTYTPRGARLTYLTQPMHLASIYQKAIEGGRRPNSVKRSLHRAVAEILKHYFGADYRDGILRDVKIPSERDERRVLVTPDQIQGLIQEAYRVETLFGHFVLLAILTAIDRLPLLRLQPRHFNEARGTLQVLDTKNPQRPRVLELSDPASIVLRQIVQGKGPEERVFPWTEGQIRHRWETARDRAAGVPSRNAFARGKRKEAMQEREKVRGPKGDTITLAYLRLKDLRHLLPSYWVAEGYSLKDLQQILGHTQISTTGRYLTEQIAGDRHRLNAVAAALGLDRPHLQLVGGNDGDEH